MRIGLLTDAYDSVLGGITNFLVLHKKALEALGHEPFIFTFGLKDSYDEESRVVRSSGIPIADSGYYFNLGFSERARRLCRTMDILHTQYPFLTGQLAIHYGTRYHIPVVFTNHIRGDLYARHNLPGVPEGLEVALWETYLRLFARQCELIICPSLEICDLIRGYGVTARIEFIPNGIEVERFQEPPWRQDRAKLGIPESAKILMYVGRLAAVKNLAFLLQAFAAVTSLLPDTYLMLVGEGPEQDNLQDQARRLNLGERVIFTGKVSYDDVPAYLAIADAFVTASVTEVHPLSVLEAIAAGLPVLGVDSPGVGETIVHERNGLLSSSDIAEFSVQLYRLMSDNRLRARLAQQARADSAQYDIRTTTRQMVSCYEEVIASYQAQQRSARKR